MIPVLQTIYAPPEGNCFPASVASILECPLSEVPHPTAEDDACPHWRPYWARFEAWLAERNLGYVEFPVGSNGWKPQGYAVLTVRPPGANYEHAVVSLNGEPVWNPWPDSERPLGEFLSWGIFTVLEPAKLRSAV